MVDGLEMKKLSAVHTATAAKYAEAALENYDSEHTTYDSKDMEIVQGLDNIVGIADTYLDELERYGDICADSIYKDDNFKSDQTVIEHLNDIEYHVKTAKTHYNMSMFRGEEVPEELSALEHLEEETNWLVEDLEEIYYIKTEPV